MVPPSNSGSVQIVLQNVSVLLTHYKGTDPFNEKKKISMAMQRFQRVTLEPTVLLALIAERPLQPDAVYLICSVQFVARIIQESLPTREKGNTHSSCYS